MSFFPERFQAFGHHIRTEVAAADTDVNDVFYFISGVTCPFTAVNAVTELISFVVTPGEPAALHFFLCINGVVAKIAQGGMQYRAAFGFIYGVAGEHGLNGFGQFTFVSQVGE